MQTTKTKEVAESAPTDQKHVPRHLTMAENMVLTIKVLAVAGGVLALLWGIDAWTAG